MSDPYSADEQAWEQWEDLYALDPLRAEAQLVESVVAQRAAQHAASQQAADWQTSQTLAELTGLTIEKELEAHYGPDTWKAIQGDWLAKLEQMDLPDQVLESPTKLATMTRYAADEVIRERRARERGEEWDRVRRAGTPNYWDKPGEGSRYGEKDS